MGGAGTSWPPLELLVPELVLPELVDVEEDVEDDELLLVEEDVLPLDPVEPLELPVEDEEELLLEDELDEEPLDPEEEPWGGLGG